MKLFSLIRKESIGAKRQEPKDAKGLTGLKGLNQKLMKYSNLTIVIGFLIVFFYFGFSTDSFFTANNIEDIVMRCTIIAPIAFGIMLTLIAKGIDLSTGAIVGLTGVIFALALEAGFGIGLAILFCVLLGLLVGSVNGFLVAKANLNPFVATLAVMFIGESVERLLTRGGLPIYLYGVASGFVTIYRGKILGIPNPIWILILLTLFYYIFLNKTEFGRKMYAGGAGIKSARIAGVKVRAYYGLAYVFSALSSVIAGLILASKVRSGQPLVGHAYLWDAIGAAYISTLVSKRNRPNVFGTLLGILFFSLVENGLTLKGIEFYWKEFFKGALIIVVLLTSVWQKRHQGA